MNELTVKVKVPTELIADLMVSAVESGYLNYWLYDVQHDSGENWESPWYSDPGYYTDKNLRFTIAYLGLDDKRHDEVVTLESILKGLEVLAEKCPRQFSELVGENGDAVTADCFLQCIIFGDIVYG